MIAGVMLSAALTSIITGITEPIEFAYTFVAPPLYLAHAALTFLSGWLTSIFDIHLGYTFSSSLIDLGIGAFNQKNMSLLFLVVGPIIGLAYFTVFYWAIGFFNFKTPGREDDELAPVATQAKAGSLHEKAKSVLAALGGSENIQNLSACITRLRLILKDSSKVDAQALKRLGAAGIMNAGGGNVQVVFGVESDFIKSEIELLMKQASTATVKTISSPIKGEFVALNEIPDETFKAELMGKTFAIRPTTGEVVAPFDGEVATLFHTRHAIGLISRDGVELLIHIGIDTVKMEGEGFKAFVKSGDSIKKGQKLIEFDLDLVAKKAKSTITPIVVTNPEGVSSLQVSPFKTKTINAGETLWNYS
jgi:glucose-specific phosphotransferase system IIA component